MERGAPAVAHLPDELVLEILARLPAKSLCRFKCVSPSWRRLICDPAHRARLAHALSGFFVFPRGRRGRARARPPFHFVIWSPHGGNDGPPLVDTALSFLPPAYRQIEVLDSCNGLLLLLCWGASPPPLLHPFYVVCNPTTREWLSLPQPSEAPGQRGGPMRENKWTRNVVLGFDPAISLNFYVFQLLEIEYQTGYIRVGAMEIYSSETGRWILSECGWGVRECHFFDGNNPSNGSKMTYLNSALHFCLLGGAVAVVDTKGEAWRIDRVRLQLVYVLEDRGSEEWTFKHNIRKADLIGPRKWDWGLYNQVVAFHPDADLIFFYDWQHKRLISYGMTHMDVHVISTIGGAECSTCTTLVQCTGHLFIPYIPLYSRTLVSPIVN